MPAEPSAATVAQGNAMVQAVVDDNEKYIEANKGSIDVLDENGCTPLYTACMRGVKLSTLQTLLRLGAKVDLKGVDRETPLYIAAFNNHIEFVKLLLAAGANINEENGKENETCLHVASKFGYIDLLQLLIKHGANVNSRTSRMETPLYSAARNAKHESIYYLLMNNANPNLGNEDGKQPLYIASEKRYKHCVIVLKAEPKFLKEAKAEADVELRMRPEAVPTNDELQQRALAARLKASAEASATGAKKDSKTSAKAPATAEKIEIIPIEIPKLVVRDHDPITGEKFGPCRTLDEVGYDASPVIPAGVKLGPSQMPRAGGTSMMVLTESGPSRPKTMEVLDDDETVEYGVKMPAAKKHTK